MLSQYIFLIICFVLLSNFSHSKLIMVTEISRHGARTPLKFHYKSNQNTIPPGELTPFGMRQHYLLGKELRSRYIDKQKFLGESYNVSEIYLKSSWKKRCHHSLISKLYGLFPEIAQNSSVQEFLNNEMPKSLDLPTHVKMDLVDNNNDYFFHANNGDLCPVVGHIQKLMKESEFYINKHRYYKMILYDEIVNIVNDGDPTLKLMPLDLDLKKVKQIFDNYKCNKINNKEYPLFTERIIKHLYDIHGFLFYDLENGDEYVVSISITEMYKEIIQFFQTKINHGTDYKFLLYSAHDKNLASILASLLTKKELYDLEDLLPPFAAQIIFELHEHDDDDGDKDDSVSYNPQNDEFQISKKCMNDFTIENCISTSTTTATKQKPVQTIDDNKYFVKIYYNEDELLLQKCFGQRCSLQQFLNLLQAYVIPDIQKMCQISHFFN